MLTIRRVALCGLAACFVVAAMALAPPATAGVLKYDYDAANDTTGDNKWESEVVAASNRDWTLDVNPAAPISVTSAHVGITKAYDFGGTQATDPTLGTTSTFAGSDIDANGPAAFEFWLKPDDLTGSEVIFESGGGTHGGAMLLVGNSLEYRTRYNNVNIDAVHTLVAGDLSDFVQVVGVTDAANNDTRIYVNGLLSQATPGMKDWTQGGNNSGLAAANSDIGAVGSPAGWGKFEGQIARARFYRGELSPVQVNATYSEIATGPEADAYSAAVLADAPIAYWRLDDPTGSISAYNRGSLGLDATGAYVNSPTPQATGLLPGLTNPATSLSGPSAAGGTDDYITVENHAQINTSTYTNKTVELWFNADAVPDFPTGRQILYEQGGSTYGLNVYLEDRQVHAGVWVGSNREWVSAGVGSGMTHHLVMTYDNGQIVGYLDGQPFGTAAGASTITAHAGGIAIGAVNTDTYYKTGTGTGTDNVNHFDGTVDEVALYNTTLTQDDVRAHLLAGGGRIGIVRDKLTLNYDAASAIDYDPSTNAVWRNMTAVKTDDSLDWNLTGATRETSGVSAHPGISASFDFSGSGSGGTFVGIGSSDSIQDILGDAFVHRAASFEIWFKPDDLTGRHILFESGGGTDGSGIYLDGSTINIAARDGTSTTNGTVFLASFDLNELPVAEQSDFTQVVGIIDPANDRTELWVNGIFRTYSTAVVEGTGAPGILDDWDGGDTAGLCQLSGSTGAPGSFTDFGGHIAMLRYYDKRLSWTDIVDNYNAITDAGLIVPEPATLSLLGLGAAGLLLRRRKRR